MYVPSICVCRLLTSPLTCHLLSTAASTNTTSAIPPEIICEIVMLDGNSLLKSICPVWLNMFVNCEHFLFFPSYLLLRFVIRCCCIVFSRVLDSIFCAISCFLYARFTLIRARSDPPLIPSFLIRVWSYSYVLRRFFPPSVRSPGCYLLKT